MIELENISKQFGRRWAVRELSLRVPEGEIFGLLGHNGAGKSTAIGMMLGQVWPTSGSVSVCGHDVASQRRQALQHVGAIFESPAFYDYLSGWRNLEIFSSYTAQTSKERLREVVDWVGLTGREHSKVGTYSHGMRARLALGQALLPNPRLLILDEPSDGLDPEGIHEMRQTILRLHRELNLTILLSSHFLSEVEQICTKIAVMNQGRKVYEGLMGDVRQAQQYVRLEVGDFDTATAMLHEAGLITSSRDGKWIVLASDVDTNRVVRFLVEKRMPVHEIARHDATLEEFYLELMSQQKTSESNSSSVH